jgi:hypothetical protein
MKTGLLGCLLLVLATEAPAHRLDEYLQATRLAVATNRIDLSIDLTPGVAVADQLLVVIDRTATDGCRGRDLPLTPSVSSKTSGSGLMKRSWPCAWWTPLSPIFPKSEAVWASSHQSHCTGGPLAVQAEHALSLTNASAGDQRLPGECAGAEGPCHQDPKQTRDELRRSIIASSFGVGLSSRSPEVKPKMPPPCATRRGTVAFTLGATANARLLSDAHGPKGLSEHLRELT